MANRLKVLPRKPLYATILIAILFAGCVGGTDKGAAPVLTEDEVANKTIEYVIEAFLKPQGLDGEFKSIEPIDEDLYVVNFTFGMGMMQREEQVYVTSGGRLILGQEFDITEPPETQPPPETAEPTEPPEPIRADVSIDGDQCLGSEDAPVTIIEFSDYQCSFCARFWEQTLPQIKEEYIDTGKVKFVYRDFPLGFHGNAQKAAEATECANDQEKFWGMHDKVFEGQGEWGGGDAVTIFKGYAAELELDEDEFADCLDSGKHTGEVQKDMEDGMAAGVQGTPAFFIDGIFVSGALPFEAFKQIIDVELANNGADSTISGTCG